MRMFTRIYMLSNLAFGLIFEAGGARGRPLLFSGTARAPDGDSGGWTAPGFMTAKDFTDSVKSYLRTSKKLDGQNVSATSNDRAM